MKSIKEMSIKELEHEYQSICQQIDELSYGTRDLAYQLELETEIARRGLEIRKNYSLVKA